MLLWRIMFSCFLFLTTEAYTLLVIFPMASKSHSILGHAVSNRLLEAGHKVVHMTAYPREQPVENYREVIVPNIFEKLMKEDPESFEKFKLKNRIGQENFGDSMLFFYMIHNFHKQFLQQENLVKFLSDPKEKFDAVIYGWFFSNTVAGIAALFQCPLIWFGSTEANWQILQLVDGIPNPAYNVDLFSPRNPPLTFWDRVTELWTIIKKSFVIKLIMSPLENSVYKSVFPEIASKRGISMPSYGEVMYNGSFLLLNSHPSIGTPFSLPQSAKYIGGFHIDTPAKPLPKNLQKLMDEANNGVIYFSMGSNLKSEDMSTEMKKSLLQMFAKLKQTVIWKFESSLDNVPPNVHLVKWAPQQSILSHPNLKFFLTHGGQSSTTEAIHFGVPVVGVPVMGDQHINMDAVVRKGFGIKVTLVEDLAKDLLVAVDEMLSNPIYKKRAMDLSATYHDRPVPPGKELVYWVEHVVKTRGALHLRSPALMLPWCQRLYLDLIALILFMILLVYIAVRRYSRKVPKQIIKKAKKY